MFSSANVDECAANNPCKNGAKCTNKHGDYTCSCSSSFTGKNCDQGNRRLSADYFKTVSKKSKLSRPQLKKNKQISFLLCIHYRLTSVAEDEEKPRQ